MQRPRPRWSEIRRGQCGDGDLDVGGLRALGRLHSFNFSSSSLMYSAEVASAAAAGLMTSRAACCLRADTLRPWIPV